MIFEAYTIIVHVAIRYECPCTDPCYCTGEMSFNSQDGLTDFSLRNSEAKCQQPGTDPRLPMRVWMPSMAGSFCPTPHRPSWHSIHVHLGKMRWRIHLDFVHGFFSNVFFLVLGAFKNGTLLFSKGSSCNLDSKLRLTGHVSDPGNSYPVVTMCAACVPPYNPNTASYRHRVFFENLSQKKDWAIPKNDMAKSFESFCFLFKFNSFNHSLIMFDHIFAEF